MEPSSTFNINAISSVTGDSSSPPQNSASEDDNEIEINISTLPQQPSWRPSEKLYKYQGFWCYPNFVQGIALFQKKFIPQPSDIVLCSLPKSGTTWLKALAFAISTRSQFTNCLLTKLPHDIVPFQELLYCLGQNRDIQNPLISTHVPFNSLPKSILNSNTKIIYICRDPKDVFVSLWHFLCGGKLSGDEKLITFQEAFDKFCNGVSAYGPYWDHVLGYWKASLEFPERVLFLKYEDLKNDGRLYVKKIADFMGCPFSVDEEKQGIVEKIVHLCSFENLSNLDVNKSSNTSIHMPFIIEFNTFFRKGKIGDWKNYLTVEMTEKFDKITHQKFSCFGLYN